MPGFLNIIKKENKPYLGPLADDIALRRNKDYFWPSGTQVYCGMQGSGKTISAVRHLASLRFRYPKAIIVSNLVLNGMKKHSAQSASVLQSALNEIDPSSEYIFFENADELALALVMVNNSFYGVIYLIDEIHVYFNALDSKNIPMYVFSEISQQRKQRKLIVGTSQLFMRMAKPLREQCDSMIMCNTYFGIFTTQRAYDGQTVEQDPQGHIIGVLKKRGWFFHSRRLRSFFDTYQKVVSGRDQFEQSQNVEISLKSKRGRVKIST